MKNIAVADIGYTLFSVLPTSSAVLAGNWIAGDLLCTLQGYFQGYLAVVDILAVCALNVTKVASIRSPLRTRIHGDGALRKVTFAVWFIPLIYTGQHVLYLDEGIYAASIYRCMVFSRAYIPEFVEIITIIAMIISPVLIVSFCSAWLIWHLRRLRGLQKQGILTLLLISLMFLVSYLPNAIYLVVWLVESRDIYLKLFHGFGVYIQFLNVMGNPYIYLLSSRSFRNFVCGAIRRV